MTCWRSGGLAILVAAVTIGLAACGGPASLGVAAVGKSNGNGGVGTATTVPNGNPTQSLIEWAACMRTHDDPGQSDPTIDINKVIWVALPAGYYNGLGLGGKGGVNSCAHYMFAAQTDLKGGRAERRPDQAELLKFSQCMQADGFPDFPDPSANGLSLNLGDPVLNPNSPKFKNASKLCTRKTGVQGLPSAAPQPGQVRIKGLAPPGGNGG